MPAFSVGAVIAGKSAFNVIMLSLISNVCVLTYVLVPVTVKFALIVTSLLNVVVPVTTKVFDRVAAPVTAIVLDKVAVPVIDTVFDKVAAPLAIRDPCIFRVASGVEVPIPTLLFVASTNKVLVLNAALPEIVCTEPFNATLPVNVVVPVTASVLLNVAAPTCDVVLAKVATPVTPKVLKALAAPVKVVAPVTPKVLKALAAS